MFNLENEHFPCGKEEDTVTCDNCSHNFTCSNDCFLTQKLFPPLPTTLSKDGNCWPRSKSHQEKQESRSRPVGTKRVVSTQKEFEPCQRYYFPKRRPSATLSYSNVSSDVQHLQDPIQLTWPGIQRLAPSILLSSFYLPEHLSVTCSKLTIPKHTLHTLSPPTLVPFAPSPGHPSPLLHLPTSTHPLRFRWSHSFLKSFPDSRHSFSIP